MLLKTRAAIGGFARLGEEAMRAGVLASAVILAGGVALGQGLPGPVVVTPGRDQTPALSDGRKLFNKGEYDACIELCQKVTKGDDLGSEGARWWVLQIQAQLATGKYAEALASYKAGAGMHGSNLALKLAGYDALRANDQPGDAAALLKDIRDSASDSPWRYDSPEDLVTIGRAQLKSGMDARKVLQDYFDKAKKADPDVPDSYLATGELALAKDDMDTAQESYQGAAERDPENPEAYFGLAQASEEDPDAYAAAMSKAVALNPHFVPALLLGADRLMSRERYADAESVLEDALKVNPKDAAAWAYRAALANLTHDHQREAAYRERALEAWKTNPEVDYKIGLLLSRSYRFAEGVGYQRKALEFDPTYQAARAQLCTDLLHVGKEDEGWTLADSVFKEDPYNVMAFNLVTLHDIIKKFNTQENDHFVLRMDPKEAPIYGQRLMDMLERERALLTAKYQVELPEKTTIEMFSAQKDFAIRTFGLPGGADYLGVCFGPVVTMNSPATRMQHPENWQDIAWHEFCHTITLTKTHNKMPRWLSEGISVYEEGQADPSWGPRMTPEYREIILKNEKVEMGGATKPADKDAKGGGVTPVSQLSTAFMDPPSSESLLFAYYESSRVVDYIVQKYGIQALRDILSDIGNDVGANEAIAKHTEPMEKLDKDFADWFKGQAENLAPKADLEKPKFPQDADDAAIAKWVAEHPTSFFGLLTEGQNLILAKKYAEAKGPLEKAVEIYPGYAEGDSPYLMLASVHHHLGETDDEREVLANYTAKNGDDVDARLRLMEIDAGKGDWKNVRREAEETIAINPLIAAPFRQLARSTEALDVRTEAISAYRTLLILDPTDRADEHFHLGKLIAAEGKDLATARREVDMALEDAPRYREAAKLLLDIAAKMDAQKQPETRPAAVPAATQPMVIVSPAPANGSPRPMVPDPRPGLPGR